MIQDAQPEGCATSVLPRIMQPCLEAHVRKDAECETSGDRVSRAFGVGRGCRGVRRKRLASGAGAAEGSPRRNVHV